jgi:hypothetical protein
MAQAEATNSTTAPPGELTLQRQLRNAGIWLDRKGSGYMVMYKSQPLAGRGKREYEMTLDQAVDFINKALRR